MAGLQRAIDDRRIDVPATWLTEAPDAPEDVGGVLLVNANGHCVFHQHDQCAIHGTLGHAAVPSSCQHFPRVCLIDPRGVSVTLSHFCPTAAWMLFEDAPVSIVDGPPVLPEGESPEGLDVRDGWPPLLTEQVLMDHESYGLWEQHMIDVLAGPDATGTAEAALARLHVDAARLAEWRPGAKTLVDAVGDLSAEAKASALRTKEPPDHPQYGGPRLQSRPTSRLQSRPTSRLQSRPTGALFELICGAVSPFLTWPSTPADADLVWARFVAPTWNTWAPVVRRYLAAHAFASWLAYQGRDLRLVVRGLDAALAVLQVELTRLCQAHERTLDRVTLHAAIRQADLLLRHYADPQTIADALRHGH